MQVYGAYYRRLSKKVQTELAEANSVAEEALSRHGTGGRELGSAGTVQPPWGVGGMGVAEGADHAR